MREGGQNPKFYSRIQAEKTEDFKHMLPFIKKKKKRGEGRRPLRPGEQDHRGAENSCPAPETSSSLLGWVSELLGTRDFF